MRNLKSFIIIYAACFIAVAAMPAPAQQKSSGTLVCWKDKAGKTIGCGDKVPPEYQENANSTLNTRGVTINQSETPLTPEQKQAQKNEAERKQLEDQKREEEKRRDRALLDSFTNEKEIDLKRARDIQQIEVNISAHQASLKNASDHQTAVSASIERLKKENIISIVKGTTKSPEFKKTASFGACANYPVNELSNFLFNIEQQGYITTDAANGKKINVTNKAIEFLTEQGLLKPVTENRDYEKDLELFHILRDARAKAATKFGQAIYLISSDEVLRNVVLAKPRTKIELLSVEGFTERMFNKYGDDILESLQLFDELKSRHTSGKPKELPDNVAETYRLIKEGLTLPEISEIRRLSQPVVSMQVETIIEFDGRIDVSKIVSEEILKLVQGELSKGISDLKSLKKIVPANTGFPELRIALAKAKALI